MGARRFSGLGMPPPTGSEFDANASRTSGTSREKEFAPASMPGGGSGAGDDGDPCSIEDTSGHFFAGFGEGLTTKSPVVYFMKTKHTGEDDCKAPINPHHVSLLVVDGGSFFFLRPSNYLVLLPVVAIVGGGLIP